MYDLIIIGAGLSGLSTALSCHSENFSVLILEKGNLPRHKVCGEYLSAEVIPLLEQWEIDLTNRPAVSRTLLSAPNGSYRELNLPLGGVGLSRYFLDGALYRMAQGRNIEIHLQEAVQYVEQHKDYFSVETKEKIYKGRWVASCHGKSKGKYITRESVEEKKRYIGVKQYYKIDFPDDLVALHTFKGGYGGAVLVENGWVDMAFMIRQDLFREFKNIQKVMEAVLFQNPWMKRLLTYGEAMWDQPMAVSNFHLGTKHQANEHIFTAGDAAAMIPPASGNGMAMALLSGVILGKNIRRGFQKSKTRGQIQQAYQKEWKSFFNNRLWWGQRIQWIMENPGRANVAMKVMKISDQLFRSTIRKTHGSPERVKTLYELE